MQFYGHRCNGVKKKGKRERKEERTRKSSRKEYELLRGIPELMWTGPARYNRAGPVARVHVESTSRLGYLVLFRHNLAKLRTKLSKWRLINGNCSHIITTYIDGVFIVGSIKRD